MASSSMTNLLMRTSSVNDLPLKTRLASVLGLGMGMGWVGLGGAGALGKLLLLLGGTSALNTSL